MVAQTVTGTRTSSLEIPTTVPIVVILVPPLERRLPLRVVSSVRIEWSSFPMISRTISPPFLPRALALITASAQARPQSRLLLRVSLTELALRNCSAGSIGAPHVRFDDGIVLARVHGLVHPSWLVSSVVIITKLRSFSAARARSWRSFPAGSEFFKRAPKNSIPVFWKSLRISSGSNARSLLKTTDRVKKKERSTGTSTCAKRKRGCTRNVLCSFLFKIK